MARYRILLLSVLLAAAGCTTNESLPPPSTSVAALSYDCPEVTTNQPLPSPESAVFHGLIRFESFDGTGSAGRAYPVSSLNMETGSGSDYFSKSPLYLAPSAVSISLKVSPGEQHLAWVPVSVWTAGYGSVDLQPAMTQNLVLPACDMTVNLLGGFVTDDPTRCFDLTISAVGYETETYSLRLDGQECPRS